MLRVETHFKVSKQAQIIAAPKPRVSYLVGNRLIVIYRICSPSIYTDFTHLF